jgi:hypothetical protein
MSTLGSFMLHIADIRLTPDEQGSCRRNVTTYKGEELSFDSDGGVTNPDDASSRLSRASIRSMMRTAGTFEPWLGGSEGSYSLLMDVLGASVLAPKVDERPLRQDGEPASVQMPAIENLADVDYLRENILKAYDAGGQTSAPELHKALYDETNQRISDQTSGSLEKGVADKLARAIAKAGISPNDELLDMLITEVKNK